MQSTQLIKYRQDIERLENQVGQLTRIIANLNERLNHLEMKPSPAVSASR